MRVIAHREEPFPDDLEGRLNAILNVVNTELKTVTLLHLDDTPADEHEIKARLRETVGKGSYLPDSSNFRAYCHKTLFPIGTVAEEEVIRDTGENVYLGFRLTESGKKYGLPIAAFTLNYIAQTGQSIFPILGNTNSRGKTRAPLNRVKILEALKEKTLRVTDLEEILGLDSKGILGALNSLAKIGSIQYDSVGELQKGRINIAPYMWVGGRNPEEAQTIRHRVTATKKIAKLMSKIKKADHNKIAELTGIASPTVCPILSGLTKQGILKRERWKGREFQSEAKLLDNGRKFLDEYLEPFKDSVSDGQALEEMQESYEQLMHDSDRFSEYARTAIAVYKQVSPYINKRPRQETNKRIVAYLRKNTGKRPVEIGRVLSLKKPGGYLTPLVKTKVLRKEKKGNEVRYYVNE